MVLRSLANTVRACDCSNRYTEGRTACGFKLGLLVESPGAAPGDAFAAGGGGADGHGAGIHDPQHDLGLGVLADTSMSLAVAQKSGLDMSVVESALKQKPADRGAVAGGANDGRAGDPLPSPTGTGQYSSLMSACGAEGGDGGPPPRPHHRHARERNPPHAAHHPHALPKPRRRSTRASAAEKLAMSALRAEALGLDEDGNVDLTDSYSLEQRRRRRRNSANATRARATAEAAAGGDFRARPSSLGASPLMGGRRGSPGPTPTFGSPESTFSQPHGGHPSKMDLDGRYTPPTLLPSQQQRQQGQGQGHFTSLSRFNSHQVRDPASINDGQPPFPRRPSRLLAARRRLARGVSSVGDALTRVRTRPGWATWRQRPVDTALPVAGVLFDASDDAGPRTLGFLDRRASYVDGGGGDSGGEGEGGGGDSGGAAAAHGMFRRLWAARCCLPFGCEPGRPWWRPILRNVHVRGGPITRSVLLYALVFLVLVDLVLTFLSIITLIDIKKPCDLEIRDFWSHYPKHIPSGGWTRDQKKWFWWQVHNSTGMKSCYRDWKDKDNIVPMMGACLDSYGTTLISLAVFPLASVMAPIFGLLALLFPETRGLRSYAQWLLLSVVNACIAFGSTVKFSDDKYSECNKDVKDLIVVPVLCIVCKLTQLALVNQYIAHMEVRRRHEHLTGARPRYHHQR